MKYRPESEAEHLGVSTFQRVQCPLTNSCQKTIQIAQLAHHIQNGHRVPLKQDRHSESFEPGKQSVRFVKVGLIEHEGNNFVTQLERHEDYCLASVFYAGPPSRAESFDYSVSISKPSKQDEVLAMYQGVANPITLASDSKCSGLYITKDLMVKFRGKKSKARVKFSVGDYGADDFDSENALAEGEEDSVGEDVTAAAIELINAQTENFRLMAEIVHARVGGFGS